MKDPRGMALDSIMSDARSYGTGRRPSKAFMIAIGVPDDAMKDMDKEDPDEDALSESQMFADDEAMGRAGTKDAAYGGGYGDEPMADGDEDDEVIKRIAQLLRR